MIGTKLNPILNEIEDVLWEFELAKRGQYHFPDESLRSATKIFMAVMMDRMWTMQGSETMDMEDRKNMAAKLGHELRTLINIYTGVDTKEFYK